MPKCTSRKEEALQSLQSPGGLEFTNGPGAPLTQTPLRRLIKQLHTRHALGSSEETREGSMFWFGGCLGLRVLGFRYFNFDSRRESKQGHRSGRACSRCSQGLPADWSFLTCAHAHTLRSGQRMAVPCPLEQLTCYIVPSYSGSVVVSGLLAQFLTSRACLMPG